MGTSVARAHVTRPAVAEGVGIEWAPEEVLGL
jgi:hypothetical protein